MKLRITGIMIMIAALLAVTACSPAGGPKPADQAPGQLTGEISLWHHYTDREAGIYQKLVDDFVAANPGVKVTVNSGQEDPKIVQVVSTGSDADVVIVNLNDTLGTLCKSLTDLDPFLQRDQIDPATAYTPIFGAATAFEGRRCSLPMTSDVYGLYYNQELWSAAGLAEGDLPKTLTELEVVALKLTTYNADGSIKTLGFNPLFGFYENASGSLSQAAKASWVGPDERSVVGSDPQWQKIISWQKAFVDKIGYEKLRTFTAALGDEWSADNAFHQGKVALNLDGEWRVAFIEDQAPKLKYGTAPFPVLADGGPEYGGGYTSGAVIGINSKSKNTEAAWALVKYLSATTEPVVELCNGFKNVPTLRSALESPDLEVPEQYRTFIDAASHPATQTTPVTTLGAAFSQPLDDFWDRYQQGDGSGLQPGLQKVQEDVNNALDLKGP
ncbi:extracellular solute-binding protein [Microlunatus speluncae]|uniref:extracellular solute-binding protein n=1 Tax=Microlunatus speluncae TaxID=2594267 RepID=UPI001C2D6576|nr:extracellular solute-binding protein [Microlunatus speluncae]